MYGVWERLERLEGKRSVKDGRRSKSEMCVKRESFQLQGRGAKAGGKIKRGIFFVVAAGTWAIFVRVKGKEGKKEKKGRGER